MVAMAKTKQQIVLPPVDIEDSLDRVAKIIGEQLHHLEDKSAEGVLPSADMRTLESITRQLVSIGKEQRDQRLADHWESMTDEELKEAFATAATQIPLLRT